MESILAILTYRVRSVMRLCARGLNQASGGRLHPHIVTLVGLLAHLPIAWLIATDQFTLGAVLLAIFGLFDSLDGELARLQKRASNGGMLLDASTDRLKEVLLYWGAAYALGSAGQPYQATWAVGALGASLLVSYVKAKGETAVAGQLPANEVNRLFQAGLMRFEVRMFILIIGLLSSQLFPALIIISIGSFITAAYRLGAIMARLG